MPFVTPEPLSVNHISNVLSNPRSRTDMFSILASTTDHLFNRVKWIRYQGVDNPQEDIGLVALKKKIEWIFQFVDGTLNMIHLKGHSEKHRHPYHQLVE